MKTPRHIVPISILLAGSALFSCLFSCTKPTTPEAETTDFTRLDSLTERYLTLQDNMLAAWNTILRDENRKFKALHAVVDTLMYAGTEDKGELVELQHRLKALSAIRLSQQSLDNPDMLEEYDFAVNSLVTEVVTRAETHSTFSTNAALQKLVEDIKITDQQVPPERAAYDSIAMAYNTFLENNQAVISEVDHDTTITPRPLFDMVQE